MKYALQKYNTAKTVGLPVAAVAIITLAVAVVVAAPSASPSPVKPVSVSAKGGNGGGGQATTVSLPANFPTGVPLPSGKLLASANTGTGWTVSLLAPGAYPSVYASTDTLYMAAGFTKSDLSLNPQLFENSQYSVTVYSRAYDHGPESTEVLVIVTQK